MELNLHVERRDQTDGCQKGGVGDWVKKVKGNIVDNVGISLHVTDDY